MALASSQVARANGETAITNVRRLAGSDRAPGSPPVLAATSLLGLLGRRADRASRFNAQDMDVFRPRRRASAAIEAASLYPGMTILTPLGMGLALAGHPARPSVR